MKASEPDIGHEDRDPPGMATPDAERARALETGLLDQLSEGFMLVDGAGRILYTNAAFNAMFGYQAGELIGQPTHRLNGGSKADSVATVQEIMASLERLSTWQGELKNRRKDGREFWTEARISAYQHPVHGQVWGCVQWDISERKREFDLIVDTIAVAVLVVGADGRIVRGNARVTEVFGYEIDELIGQPIEILIPARHRAHHVGLRGQFAQETRTRMMGSNRELFGLRKDGHEFPVEVGLGPMLVGSKPFTIVSVADISHLRDSEEKVRQLSLKLAEKLADTKSDLQTSERNFRELAENIHEVFWLVSPDWSVVHYVSPAYEEIWGVPLASLYAQPKSWFEAIHPDDRAVVEAYLAMKTSGDLDTIDFPEFRVMRPDGTTRWVKSRGNVVRDAAGSIYRVAGTSEDVTERKLMNERLRTLEDRNAEAQRKKIEEERRRLSMELHDEVGQMLAALNINLEMVRRKQANIDGAVPFKNARQITNELMKTVRRIVHELRPPQLDDLGLIPALRWHLEVIGQNSMMTVRLDENLGDERLAPDVEMICFRVVQESITNSLRHASASHVDVILDHRHDRLALTIIDDGIGCDLAHFSWLDPRSAHFGLRGMRERVHSLGGSFRITSEPAKGFQIHAVIPLA